MQATIALHRLDDEDQKIEGWKAESQPDFAPLKLVIDALQPIDNPSICEMGADYEDDEDDALGIVRAGFEYFTEGGGSPRSVEAWCRVDNIDGLAVFFVSDEDGREHTVPLADPNAAKKAAKLLTADISW